MKQDFKKWMWTDRFLSNLKLLSCIIIILIPIIYASIRYVIFQNNYYNTLGNSVQILIIGIGTFVMILFIVVRKIDVPNISNLNYDTATLYFSTTVSSILAIYTIFGIAFSILWGSLYTLGIGENRTEYCESLKGQGFILLLFIFCSSFIVFYTFLVPLLEQIKKKQKNNDGN